MDTQPSPPLPSPKLCSGCDISEYSGGSSLDLGALCDKYDFLIMRATIGESAMDQRFLEYLTSIDVPIRLGTYQAFFANRDPETQAKFYARAISSSRITLDPMIDFEMLHGVDPGEAVIRCLACVEATEEATGKTCLLYTYPYFIKMCATSIMLRKDSAAQNALIALSTRPLAIAHYQNDAGLPTQPDIPKPWTDWAIWQYKGNVREAHGVIDLDYMKEAA